MAGNKVLSSKVAIVAVKVFRSNAVMAVFFRGIWRKLVRAPWSRIECGAWLDRDAAAYFMRASMTLAVIVVTPSRMRADAV
jgi:hypothetical protein